MSKIESDTAIVAFGHHQYRKGHSDGVHCAGSVECDWRGDTIEDWEAHREENA